MSILTHTLAALLGALGGLALTEAVAVVMARRYWRDAIREHDRVHGDYDEEGEE